ncbi:divisome protein SepX/GlpR [Corynebacterium casei]|uniref:divisome protein SepX/GlpR n=1 Tax=Corynebacterium casei TaxID=160386 RepID=UPI003FD27293
MSPGLAIVLIIVVWLLVLAPVLLRGQKPMSRTGEAFDDTRVLFEGDSGVLESNRGPKLSAKAARIKARKEADAAKKSHADDASAASADSASATTSEEYAQLGDVKAEKQTIAGAAARIKSEYDNAASAETAEPTEAAANAEADTTAADTTADNSVEAETIEGEIVYEVDTIDTKDINGAEGTDSADVVDAEFTDADLTDIEAEKQNTQADEPKADAVPVSAVLIDDDAELLDEDDDILLEDEPREEAKPKTEEADEKQTSAVAASEGQVFTAPAAYELADDAYDMDDTYLSPVDMMYPGAVDSDIADAEETTSSHQDSAAAADADDASSDADNIDNNDNVADADADIDAEESVQQPVEVAEYDDEFEDSYVAAGSDSELSEEELEFAQARVGRGGWDPEADAANKATRYQRRQRTLFGLALVVVLTVALGIVFGGWLWWTAAVAGGLTIAYLVALRTQVRQEQQLRARRIAQLRRARLGVRSAEDEELAIPRSLRRPGAVIVEIDDSSPDWDHLPEVYEEVEEAPQRPSQRRQRRDDLASRRVG